METSNPTNNTTDQQQHASTYTPGEDSNRLASAAQYFGIRNTRTPLRPIREQNLQTESDSMQQQQQQQQIQIQNQDQQSYQRNTNKSPNNETNTNFTNQQHHPTEFDSKSILKFGSTVWNNVGMVFSDSTLEAARMHSVGVTAAEEHVAGDGTLHLRSIVRRMKTKKPPVMKLGDMFKPPLEEGVGQEITFEMEGGEEEEEVEYEEVVVDTVEGGSIPAAIFGIIKGMVGPAVLYLPRGFAISGYAIAIPAMFCATISYLYCATRLLQCWKVESDARIEPPIHTEYFLSGGAIILIFIVVGAKAVISFCILSAIPGNIVVPPDSTVLAYRSLRISTSQRIILVNVVSCIPADSIPRKAGWNSDSGHLNLSLPIVIT